MKRQHVHVQAEEPSGVNWAEGESLCCVPKNVTKASA